MAKGKTPRDLALKKAGGKVKGFLFAFLVALALGFSINPILQIPQITKIVNQAGLTVEQLDSTLAAVFLALTGICFIGMLIAIADKGKVKKSYCPYCGAAYDYEDNISWDVSGVVTGGNTRTADVQFVCECGECGKQTSFSKKLTIAHIDNNGNLREYSIHDLAKKCFRQ